MKLAKNKHIIIVSIIFLTIIASIINVYNSAINLLESEMEGSKVYRVVATKDIEIGELITHGNVERIVVIDPLDSVGKIYKLEKSDNIVESFDETLDNLEKSKKSGKTINMRKDDDLWAIGKVAKEKIYKGEFLISQRLDIRQ